MNLGKILRSFENRAPVLYNGPFIVTERCVPNLVFRPGHGVVASERDDLKSQRAAETELLRFTKDEQQQILRN